MRLRYLFLTGLASLSFVVVSTLFSSVKPASAIGNKAYCCEFYPVANGDSSKLLRVSFRSFPVLAQTRCAAIAAQYLQYSSYARSGQC